MTSHASISTRGFDEYLERIVQAGRDVDEAAAKAVLAAAEIVQEEMQGLVPVKTGNLKDHIRIKGPEQDGNYTSADVGVIHDRAFTDADTARYGNAVEYGTARTRPQSYIRAGIDRSRNKARAEMKRVLEEEGAL